MPDPVPVSAPRLPSVSAQSLNTTNKLNFTKIDPESEFAYEFPSAIRIYKSGRVKRLCQRIVVPSGIDSETGVTSKDVIINPSTGVSAHIYLPDLSCGDKKLPILVCCHGGGFVTGSAFASSDHAYMNRLTSQANAITVSVEYHLAPENPTPIQYDDTLEVLKWVTAHANCGPEPWLTIYREFGNVFVIGFSTSGNVVHNVALRDVHFKGLVVIQPYFITNKKLPPKPTDLIRTKLEEAWWYVCPRTSGLDDPRANPQAEGARA